MDARQPGGLQLSGERAGPGVKIFGSRFGRGKERHHGLALWGKGACVATIGVASRSWPCRQNPRAWTARRSVTVVVVAARVL